MHDFKTFTSKKLREQLEEDGNEKLIGIFTKAALSLHKQKFKIWQDDYHPVALFSEKWFAEKMDYIHMNPVRKGFVEIPEYWKYSSARNWINDDHSIIYVDKGTHCVALGQARGEYLPRGTAPGPLDKHSVGTRWKTE